MAVPTISRSWVILVIGVFIIVLAIAAYLKTIISISQTMQTHLGKIRIENDIQAKSSDSFWTQSSVLNFFKPLNGRQVLLIGDSIDRFMLSDWCDRNIFIDKSSSLSSSRSINTMMRWMMYPQDINDNSSTSPFKAHEKWYREIWDAGMRCNDRSTGDSISAIHIFGSSDHGPYYYGFKNQGSFQYIDTKPRVQYALRAYISLYGIPDRLVLHTTQWDKKYYYESFHNVISNDSDIKSHHIYHQRLQEYEQNLNKRINQIISLLTQASSSIFTHDAGKSCQIVLRTAIWNYETGEQHFLHDMNNITRRVAQERGLLLYDHDEDVWSVYDHDYSSHQVFRDAIHPNPRLSVSAANKLLGRRYVHPMATIHTFHNKSYDMIALQQVLREEAVYLIQSSSDMYFLHRISSNIIGRWSLAGISMMQLRNRFQLGSYDVLSWHNDSAIQLATVDQGQICNKLLSSQPYLLARIQVDDHRSHAITLTSKNMTAIYTMLMEGYYFPMNVSLYDAWVRISPPSAIISEPLPPYWTQYRNSIMMYGGELPPIYAVGSLASCVYDPVVYLIHNMTRMVVNNINASTSYIVKHCQHLTSLPIATSTII